MQGLLPREVGVQQAGRGEQRAREAVSRDGGRGRVAAGGRAGVRLVRRRCGGGRRAGARRAGPALRVASRWLANEQRRSVAARRETLGPGFEASCCVGELGLYPRGAAAG